MSDPREAQLHAPRRVEPKRGDVLHEIDSGRWWAWTGFAWVRCDIEFISRLAALLQDWEGGEDGIRKAAASEIRRSIGDVEEWLG